MTKFSCFILLLFLLGCQTSDPNEKIKIIWDTLNNRRTSDTIGLNEKWSDITLQQILDTKKGLLQKLILKDIKSFDKVPKDTLVVHFQSFDFCGNSPIERLDGSPLFNEVKKKATAFGFKTIIKDTTEMLDIKRYGKNLPHYNLDISAYKNTATIMQYYKYIQNDIETITDTTIKL